MHRRRFLATAAAYGCLATGGVSRADGVAFEDDDEAIERARSRLEKVDEKASAGRATARFRLLYGRFEAIPASLGRFCEGHFGALMREWKAFGLEPTMPEKRMTLVVLSEEAYRKLARDQKARDDSAGFYDPWSRSCFASHGAESGHLIDEVALRQIVSHELTHQATYHTRLFDDTNQPPECIQEGFATAYSHGSDNRTASVRRIDEAWLQQLARAQMRGPVGLPRLFDDDDIFLTSKVSPEACMDAYAWSSMLVYMLMTRSDLLPRFRKYLRAIQQTGKAPSPSAQARAHLGDLSTLEWRLQRIVEKMNEQPGTSYRSVRRIT